MAYAEKILYLGEFIGFAGGIERYAYQTAFVLREAGISVDYAGEKAAREESLFRSGFRQILSPREALESPSYDLVIIHKLCPASMLKRFQQQYGKKLIFFAHDHDLYCMRRHYYIPFGRANCHRAFTPLCCLLCSRIAKPKNWKRSPLEMIQLLKLLRRTRVIVLSDFMRKNLIRNSFPASHISQIPPFADPVLPRTDFMPRGTIRLLFAGQLIRGKGCDFLLDAVRQLSCPFQLIIAGDGPERKKLELQCRSLGLTECVTFSGWISDTRPLMRKSDLLIFPSIWQEPFGLSGLEASAQGLPVVAFRNGGVGEWLKDGVNGFSVQERNTGELARAIERVQSTPGLAEQFSRNAIQLVSENFGRKQFVSAIKQLMRT